MLVAVVAVLVQRVTQGRGVLVAAALAVSLAERLQVLLELQTEEVAVAVDVQPQRLRIKPVALVVQVS
jgi:hypothetical protein